MQLHETGWRSEKARVIALLDYRAYPKSWYSDEFSEYNYEIGIDSRQKQISNYFNVPVFKDILGLEIYSKSFAERVPQEICGKIPLDADTSRLY